LFWLGFGTKEMGSGVSLGVFEYACEGGFVSDRDWPGFVNPQFVYLTKRPRWWVVLVLGDTDLSVSVSWEIEDWYDWETSNWVNSAPRDIDCLMMVASAASAQTNLRGH